MYKLFSSAILIVLIIFSFCAVCIHPVMHKNIMIYNYEFKVPTVTQETTRTIKEELPSKTNTVKTEKSTITEKSAKTKQITATNINQTKNKNLTKQTNKTITKNNNSNTINKTTTVTETIPETKKTEIVKVTQTQNNNAEEELILWNKWRSDIQNQIMNDVKMPIIKEGTIFKFSFEVDKYGRITNIKTWSTDPIYTAFAIQYIAPVIRSYQGKSILNFPTGSNRFNTIVEGGWKISKTLKYSTPEDFKDTEVIRQ